MYCSAVIREDKRDKRLQLDIETLTSSKHWEESSIWGTLMCRSIKTLKLGLADPCQSSQSDEANRPTRRQLGAVVSFWRAFPFVVINNVAHFSIHHSISRKPPTPEPKEANNKSSQESDPASTMAPKKNTSTTASAASSKQASSPLGHMYVVDKVWNGYWETTGHQTLMIDAFLAFLLLVGGLQFLYFIFCSKDVSNPTDRFTVMGGWRD